MLGQCLLQFGLVEATGAGYDEQWTLLNVGKAVEVIGDLSERLGTCAIAVILDTLKDGCWY